MAKVKIMICFRLGLDQGRWLSLGLASDFILEFVSVKFVFGYLEAGSRAYSRIRIFSHFHTSNVSYCNVMNLNVVYL